MIVKTKRLELTSKIENIKHKLDATIKEKVNIENENSKYINEINKLNASLEDIKIIILQF